MATRLYLPSSGTAPLPSLAADANWELTTGLGRLPCFVSGSSLQNTVLFTVSGTWPAGTTQQWVWFQFQSEQLLEAYNWSGTTTSMVIGKCAETTTAGDTHLAYSVRVVSASGTSVRGTVGLYHATSTEFPLMASAATRIHNARTNGNTNFNSQIGDRLIIEIGLHGVTPALEIIQMRIGSPTGTVDFALTEALTTDLRPWVEFSKNVLFGTPPTTINLDPALLSLQGKPVSVSSPAPPVTVNLDPALLSLNGKTATPSAPPPSTQVNLQPARLSLSGKSSSIQKGAVSVPLDPAQLSLSGKSSTVQKGAVSVSLDPAQLSLSGKQTQVTAPIPGIQINLQPARLSISGKQSSIQEGAVSIALDPALLNLNGKDADISTLTQINLQPARLSISGKQASIQKGSVTVTLDPALLTLRGKNVTISAPAPGIEVNLQPARLSLSSKSSTLQKGAVSISLDPAQIILHGKPISVSSPISDIQINLDAAHINIVGKNISVDTPTQYGLIADINHEIGNTSEYSSVVGGFYLNVTPQSALAGSTYGLEVHATGTSPAYGKYVFLNLDESPFIGARFYLDSNGISCPSGTFYLASIFNDADFQFCGLYLNQVGLQHTIRLSTINAGLTTKWSNVINISDEPHWIEFLVKRESATGTVNGELYVWVDNDLKSSRTDLDNFNYFTNSEYITFGKTSARFTNGTFYVDELIVRDDGQFIGPASYPPTPPTPTTSFGGGGGFRKPIVVIMPENLDKKKRKEEEEVLIMH